MSSSRFDPHLPDESQAARLRSLIEALNTSKSSLLEVGVQLRSTEARVNGVTEPLARLVTAADAASPAVYERRSKVIRSSSAPDFALYTLKYSHRWGHAWKSELAALRPEFRAHEVNRMAGRARRRMGKAEKLGLNHDPIGSTEALGLAVNEAQELAMIAVKTPRKRLRRKRIKQLTGKLDGVLVITKNTLDAKSEATYAYSYSIACAILG